MLRALAVLAVLNGAAHASDDLGMRTIVFARGAKLVKSDARGKAEADLATLPAAGSVRALRTDALGKVLLADIAGSWSWIPLDGSTKELVALPCEPGPAQLSTDGLYVLCRGKTGSLVFNTKSGKVTPIDVPIAGARLVGMGSDLRLVWADTQGVWSAVPPARKHPRQLAPEAPLRALLPSPDGMHAVGVYPGETFEGPKKKKPTDLLMVFALDGIAARRKAIQNGVPVEWSHDSKWVLIQDGSSACIMLAAGGQYKCWRGYTAASLSPDGKYALLLGNRDRGTKITSTTATTKKTKASAKTRASGAKTKASTKTKAKATTKATIKTTTKSKTKTGGTQTHYKQPPPDLDSDLPVDEPELPGDAHGDDPTAGDDVPVPPPSGPLALYRAELDGAFTKAPALVIREVDGAAVWLP
jgi:hypothetical protein